jgi:hypothetical protein
MINELILTALIKVLNRSSPSLAKKIYSESEFKNHIDIDVRSSSPINIRLNGDIPEITIYLKITNRSPYLDVKLNRAAFSLWMNSDRGSQPLFNHFWILSLTHIKRGTSEEIFCQKELNKFQVEFVEEIKDSREITANLSPFELWFDSSSYPAMVVKTNLENKPCRIG